MTESPSCLKARITANLARFERRTVELPGMRRAAVALVLAPCDEGVGFLFTKRSYSLRRGAGQYALPGGNIDPDESPVAAALRELQEELGVALEPETALGPLDDFVTRGGHVVTPIIFWSDATPVLKPSPDEVHAAWLIPLSAILRPDLPRWLPGEAGGAPILQMRINKSWVNPPTAAMIYQFREVAIHGRPVRVATVGQPAWTAR
jgi:8-oxo-dGTP pyrophosphatase MutT (NUDIX family)